MLGMYSNNIRIVSVNYIDESGVASTTWEDGTGTEGPKIKIPHPFIGNNGEGIFIGLQPGNLVAVGMLSQERCIPLAVIPNYNGSLNLASQAEVSFDFSGSPNLSPGDIVINGPGNSSISFGKKGSIEIKNSYNEGQFLYGFDSSRLSLDVLPPVKYTISQSGIKVDGLIRRDLWVGKNNEFDGIDDPYSEFAVEEIGWDPTQRVSLIKRGNRYRNPSLTESREIILEYGRNFIVGTYDEESSLLNSSSIQSPREDDRRERRSNVLSLSLTYPNELIEKSNGTLVDFFGNILDINKNIIGIPVGTNNDDFLNSVFENMRHSVAYHMAINTRKGWSYRKEDNASKEIANATLLKNGVPEVNDFSNNSKDRSKWEINVDKEGLTVINIPATSETGTVPRITRYETSSVLSVDDDGKLKEGSREPDDTKKVFRNSKNQDIFLEQVGPGGIDVVGDQIENRAKDAPVAWIEDEKEIKKSPAFIQAGTAFHDIRKTARLILEKDLNKKTYTYPTLSPTLPVDTSGVAPDPEAVSSEITSSIPDFANPALLQKVYIEEEEIIAGATIPKIDVINGEVVSVTSVVLYKEDGFYVYDLEKQKYYIRDNSLSNDPNSLIMSSLGDKSVYLNIDPVTYPNFPMPIPGDKILISYYYKGKQPNAGGRSAVLNLDGSLETSIGANTVDRVSWTLDTAGAIIARIGRDKQGRSAIIHADGYVAIEIGGWDFVGEEKDDSVDTRFVGQGVSRSQSLTKDPYRFKGGKLVIRIRRSEVLNPGNPDEKENDHLIIIDDSGITLKSAGVFNLISKQTMTLESEANICLNAPNVIMYGNSSTRRFVKRKGDGNI